MRERNKAWLLITGILAVGCSMPAFADDARQDKVNYKDNVAPIFQARCNACHNGDQAKGGLVLDTYGGAMKGGGSGAVVEPGDPDNSRLYLLVAHQEEPKMPPKADRIPDAELAAIRAWIEAGAPETSGSVVVMNKPKVDLKLDPGAVGKPAGEPAMPDHVPTEVVVSTPRANAITALAASPWAPLVAIAGHKQVVLYRTDMQRLVGVLPFQEGNIHALRFSRDGAILLAAGGRGAREGKAVGFDVKTGQRLFEAGKEYDVALAADLSPDRTKVALGGPGKLLRVYSTADGSLLYEAKKHTDWVTAIEFSPDGVLLASGDRNGGLLVWEAETGREFYDLRGHGAMITEVSWRLDSNVLASSSEDGTVRLWEMNGGSQVKSWGAHGGGATSVHFSKDGRLVSTGRDRVAKLWDGNGAMQKQIEGFAELTTRAVFTHDSQNVVVGDWSGEVRLCELSEGKKLALLPPNPAPLAQRLSEARNALQTAEAAVVGAQKELGPLEGAVATAQAGINQVAEQLKAAEAQSASAIAAQQAAEAQLAQMTATQQAAADLVRRTQAAEQAFVELKAAADQNISRVAEAKRLAAERARASKTEADRKLADEAEQAYTAAIQFAASLDVNLASLRASLQPAQATAASSEALRVAAAQAVEALKPATAEAAKLVETRKAELAGATNAKAAAEQALAEKQAAIQALEAQAAAKKAEVDDLAAEAAAKPAGVAATTKTSGSSE
jgi:WD40 repeat protein